MNIRQLQNVKIARIVIAVHLITAVFAHLHLKPAVWHFLQCIQKMIHIDIITGCILRFIAVFLRNSRKCLFFLRIRFIGFCRKPRTGI